MEGIMKMKYNTNKHSLDIIINIKTGDLKQIGATEER